MADEQQAARAAQQREEIKAGYRQAWLDAGGHPAMFEIVYPRLLELAAARAQMKATAAQAAQKPAVRL